MTGENYQATGTYIGWAKKMATWRNGDAKLTAANVLASDKLIQVNELTEPIGMAEPRLKADSVVPKYETTRYSIGSLTATYAFQTGRLLYPFLGGCATTDDDPAGGYYTHALSTRTSQTPLNMGRHLERENETDAESERIDILGMLPVSYHLECTESRTQAYQSASWRVAYCKDTSTDDIAQPTEPAMRTFEWTNLTFPVFTYNSETIEASIIGFSFDIVNEVGWRGLDSGGHFSVGKLFNFADIAVSLMIVPTGKNAFELIRTLKESYATDLDLTWKFTRDATYDYVNIVHDKLYAEPFALHPAHRRGWHEGYLIRMHQDGAGSVSGTVIDALDDDNYET